MADEDRFIHDTAQALLNCAYEGILEAGLPTPCRICVVPGQIAWDDCSDGGQLEIALDSVFYSTDFPQDTTVDTAVNSACGPGIVVASMTLSLMRCAPMPAGLTARAPTCEALEEAALLVARDNYVLRTSLLCCLKQLRDERIIVDSRLNAMTVGGPQGGCVGNSVVIFIGFANA